MELTALKNMLSIVLSKTKLFWNHGKKPPNFNLFHNASVEPM